LGRPADLLSFTALSDRPGPDLPPTLLLAVASPPEAEAALRLAQGISLQRLPVDLILLAGDRARAAGLEVLDGRGVRRLRWPEDAAALTALLRDHWPPKAAVAPPAGTLE